LHQSFCSIYKEVYAFYWASSNIKYYCNIIANVLSTVKIKTNQMEANQLSSTVECFQFQVISTRSSVINFCINFHV